VLDEIGTVHEVLKHASFRTSGDYLIRTASERLASVEFSALRTGALKQISAQLAKLAVRFAAERASQATLGPAILDKDCGS
jgi:hypothetical protein